MGRHLQPAETAATGSPCLPRAGPTAVAGGKRRSWQMSPMMPSPRNLAATAGGLRGLLEPRNAADRPAAAARQP
jgi:hypothetical protein